MCSPLRENASGMDKETDLPPGWITRISKRFPGVMYFFNTVTAETSWEPPEYLSTDDDSQSSPDNVKTPRKRNTTVRFNPIKTILKISCKEIKTSTYVKKNEHSGRSILALRPPLSPVSSPPRKLYEENETTLEQFSCRDNKILPKTPKHNVSPNKRKIILGSSSEGQPALSQKGQSFTVYRQENQEDIEMTDVSKEIFQILHRPLNLQTNPNALHVVVDTNILMHNLDFLDDLKDVPLTGYGLPIIVVPWVVFQELDSIKRREEPVQSRANQAIRYLHKKISHNHPRIKGQVESSDRIDFQADPDSNDDRILYCILQLASRVGYNLVVFLSNDKNFVSKAIIRGVAGHTIESFQEAFPFGVIEIKNKNRHTGFVSGCVLPKTFPPDQKVGTESQRLETIVCQGKALLKNVLSNLVRSEMISVYDDTWLEVVHYKPPWSLFSVLSNIKKHWVSVFSYCMNSDALEIITQLLILLKNCQETNYTNIYSDHILTLCLNLCLELHKRHGTCQNELTALQGLIEDLDDKNVTSQSENVTFFKKPRFDHHSSVEEKESNLRVLAVFQHLWCSFNNLTGTLLDSLGRSHDFLYVAPDNPVSKKDCLDFIPKFYPVLHHMENNLRHVILVRDSDHRDHKMRVQKLYQLMKSAPPYLGISTNVPEEFTFEDLSLFVSNEANLNLLSNGFDQLSEFVKAVFQCITSLTPQDAAKELN